VAKFRDVDLISDLLDRDFTFNAMAVDLRHGMQMLIDPLDGEKDLQARIVRRCSKFSLLNDPIRALRAVRQSIQFDASIEPKTLADIRSVSDRIADTSPERVRDELFKLFSAKRPSRALRIATALGLLKRTLPESTVLQARPFTRNASLKNTWEHSLLVVEKLRAILDTIGPQRTDQTAAVFSLGMMVVSLDVMRSQLQAHFMREWPDGRTQEEVLVFAALLHEVGTGTDERVSLVAQRATELRLSNDEKRRLTMMLRALEMVNSVDVSDVLSLHRFWRAFGDAGVDACLVAMADVLGTNGVELQQDEWLRFLERTQTLLNAYLGRYEELVDPPQLVDGSMLIDSLGLAPGRIIGELIDLIREAQVEGRIHSSEEAMRYAKMCLQKVNSEADS
jgi:poly(A) polymerase/tRNA nucleotidyltransferase (CCA-adding enzyme)